MVRVGNKLASGEHVVALQKGRPTVEPEPGHREVIGASPFCCRVAGMRDAIERGRDLRARGRESARTSAARGSLSRGPFGAETGERAGGEPGSRPTQTEIRFTDGEKLRTALRRRARIGDGRRGSRVSGVAVTRTPQVGFRLILDRSRPVSDLAVEQRGERVRTSPSKLRRCPAAAGPRGRTRRGRSGPTGLPSCRPRAPAASRSPP